ncbi:putative membrane protein [Microbispora amethystogenes]|nr:putative membrane protein [Microbispora amethystogenes]
MTATTTGTTTGARRGRGREAAWISLVVLLVLGAAALPALLAPDRPPGRLLDPADTSLGGSAALARLLEAHGVEVVRVETPGAAVAAAGPETLLLVTEASMLGDHDAAVRLAEAPGDRLIAGHASYLDVLAAGLHRKGVERTRSRPPRCALREAVRAGDVYTGGLSFSGPPGSTGCYPAGDGHTLVRYTEDGHTVTALGDASFLTNLRLADDGNAALALNLAGARPKLVWLTWPDDPDDAADGGDGATGADGEPARSLGDLIPGGVNWAVFQLVVAVAVTALWRGRRLGPVVTERLPVVVRASETVEGRGLLYRSRRARDRAALALRAATADRLAPLLGVPRTATAEEVADAAAARTGQDPGPVRALLCGPEPADDAALVALAAQLDTLERQVRDS